MDLTLWPDHCVQGTRGAEIDADLRESFEAWKSKGKIKIVRKVCSAGPYLLAVTVTDGFTA